VAVICVFSLTLPVSAAHPEYLRGIVHDGHHGSVSLVSAQSALIMNGTYEPVVTAAWIDEVMSDLVAPSLGGGYTGEAMDTPEVFWPISGLGSLTFNNSVKAGYELLEDRVDSKIQNAPASPIAVFGYSQSSVITAALKRNLAREYAGSPTVPPPVSLVMLANPLRPNGGILSRLPLLAALLTPWTKMDTTPTDTAFTTVDVARQYDAWSDFPTYPLNLLSTVNALFGLVNHWYLPESTSGFQLPAIDMVSLDPASPNYNPNNDIQQYGDTSYVTIPSTNLPLFYPLRWVGLGPLVDIIEPLVRVFVELGYDRSLPYGEVVRAQVLPGLDALTADNAALFVSDVSAALRQGVEAAVGLFTRPSPTPRPGVVPAPVPAAPQRAISALRTPSPGEGQPAESAIPDRVPERFGYPPEAVSPVANMPSQRGRVPGGRSPRTEKVESLSLGSRSGSRTADRSRVR